VAKEAPAHERPLLPDAETEELAMEASQAVALPAAPEAVIVAIPEMPSADEADAEAFARRFRRLRENDALQQRSSNSLVYDESQSLDSQTDQMKSGPEVMGMNTRILQEVRRNPAEEDTFQVEYNLASSTEKRPRKVWDHQGSSMLSGFAEEEEASPTNRRDVADSRSFDSPEQSQEPRGASKGSQGSVRLPKIENKLSRARTAPSSIRLEDSLEDDSTQFRDSIQSALENSSVKALRDRLRSEMNLHEQTRKKNQELERRLQAATTRKKPAPRASSEDKPRFGITPPTAYAKGAKPEKEKRSIVLPPLKSPKQQPPKRPGDPVGPVVQEMLREEKMSALSRQEQSRTRIQAFGKLGHAGLSTWDVRLDEKVSRYQDMKAFSESMWNSFYDWNSQYQSVG